MSDTRPTVAADLIAAMIESTPDRVRRRLDRAPDAADGWSWEAGESSWSVETGGETVTLPRGLIHTVEQISCTCLLSPRCFHVLACVTRLEVALGDLPPAQETEPVAPVAIEGSDDSVEPTNGQRRAAISMVASLSQLLRVGIANSGVVLQSEFLRAIHQCRAEGLHRAAALGLRVIAAIGEIRSRAAVADPEQLAEDLADLLETSRRVLGERSVAAFWIGTARRRQRPVRPRRLLGLFAEPIITRSGYAGAAVTFLGGDGRFYTASDVRPGDAQRARDAYLGGIEIGSMVQSARLLARRSYLGTDLTASVDGRLGRGQGAQLVEQGPSSWQAEAIEERFRRPIEDQWGAAYAQSALPADTREAAWDLVFLEGTVLGAAGPALFFQLSGDPWTVRLAIANETEGLYFRENLRMLSHAPGLRLKVLGRLNLLEPRTIFPLAVAAADTTPTDDRPGLDLPQSWEARICLGFDEIQRPFLRNAQDRAVLLDSEVGLLEDPLGPLHRRWIATMLSGTASRRQASSSVLMAEVATLHRGGFTTGAALLDSLSRELPGEGAVGIDTFLATAIYLRACAIERARFEATLEG